MPEIIERTVYRYDELNGQAKERAIKEYCDGALHYDWWDFVYEDAIATAKLLGISIDTHTVKTSRGRKYQETCIFFSGFCSQGDGACYTGHYHHPDGNIVEAVIAHASQDEELKRIAEGLVRIQVQARMQYNGRVAAKITTSGNYSHSRAMNFDISHDNDESSGYSDDFADLEADLTQLLRDFADWIYTQLEAEHNYLTSDEYAVEYFTSNDTQFDEDGVMI